MPSPDSTTNGGGSATVVHGNGHHHYHEDDGEPTSMMGSSENVDTFHHQGDGEDVEGEEKRKHGRDRPRKRKLYADICKQMEFYFSDANITKNIHMRKVIEEANANSDGFVDLNVFLEFTKMQRLTEKISHIQKALVKSEKLELSDDLLKARRKVPFDATKLKSDDAVEECTIYVENIPRDAEHEWLERIFQAFGSVAYISLPKSKRGHHKGFAFVEFDDLDSARRCLEVYGEEGACLPNDMDPAELRSIQSFKEEQEEAEADSGGSQNKKQASAGKGQDLKKQKRKADEVSEEDEPKPKKEKLDSSSSGSDDEEKVTTTETDSKNLDARQDDIGTSGSKKSKKKRKKNKSKKTIEARLESESIVLKVLPKKSWRQLRNRYLNLQRNNMAKLKKQLKREHMRAQHFKNFYQPPSQHIPCPQEDVSDSGTARSQHQQQLDLIMEVKMQEPFECVETFKHKVMVDLAEQDEDEAAISGFVKFVDYAPKDSIAYVRINSDTSFASRAENLLQKSKEVFGTARFLSNKEVDDYKQRVQATLKQRLKDQPRKNVRGKDRLMKAATKSTHIRFESDSEAEEESGRPEVHEKE